MWKIGKSRAAGEWFTNSSSALPTSQVVYLPINHRNLWSIKPRPNDPNMPTQHIATLLGATCCVRLATVLRCVGCCWLKFDQLQTWANNTQHVATHRNTVAKRTQHVGPTMLRYVALTCCDRLARALLLHNNLEDARIFHEFTGTINHSWPIRARALIWLYKVR